MPLDPGTRAVHAGHPAPTRSAPFAQGPVFASAYHLAGDPAGAPHQYARYTNPTWDAYEAALGELEGGEAVSFGSGIAAVHAAMAVMLRPGDALILPTDGYYATRQLAQEVFGPMSVEIRLAPTAGDQQGDLLEGARLLWIETPANPSLDVCDIRALCEQAHAAGALVAVDNTLATPLGQVPLALGADFSVASDTKALCGHSDLLMGHVATADPEWAERLRTWRKRTGAIPGPMETWLAHRSLGTLDVRLERMDANALAVARFLSERPDVQAVRYPGLPSDPAHALASRQMRRFGPVLTFDLGSAERASRFLAAADLIWEATSFGGLHTTGERRARWGGDDVPEGFIRLSVGCEAAADLVADLERALGAAG